MTTVGLIIPGNIQFTGTVSSPLFICNQRVIAPIASGTTSTISFGSMAGSYSSLSQAYAATLSVGTLLNYFSTGSSNTSLISRAGNISTLTVGSMSASIANVASLSASICSITTLNAAIANIATITGTTINLPGSNIVNFGSDQAGAASAGDIGYQIATPGALDIYGAGVTVGSRNVKIWDNLLVAGTTSGAVANTGTVTGALMNFATYSGSTLGIAGAGSVCNLNLGGASGFAGTVTMPVLTSTTGGGFTVSASSVYSSSYNPYNAFDTNTGGTTTAWVSANLTYASITGSGLNAGTYTGAYTGSRSTTNSIGSSVFGEYLQVQTPSPYQLQSYVLQGYAVSSTIHYLTGFTIMGSVDGVSYTIIDSRVGQDCSSGKIFVAPYQTQSCNYFRLIINQDITTESNIAATRIQNFAPVFVTAYQLDITGPSRITGSLTVVGALAKDVGTFQIPHPIRDGFDLLHSFIEGPRCDLIYRGRRRLRQGKAQVDIERESSDAAAMTTGTFEALCQNPQAFVRNNDSWDRVRAVVSKNYLDIECNNVDSSVMIDWMVVAERKDSVIRKWDKTDESGRLITEHRSA